MVLAFYKLKPNERRRKMSKKHYIRFAKMLKDKKEQYGIPNETREMAHNLFHEMVIEIADIFEEGNTRFNRDKFFDAIYK